MQDNIALKHHQKRARMLGGTPLVNNWVTKIIDVIIYPIGTVSLLMTLPQAYEVWILGHVEGVSLISWASWTVISVFWVIYGLAHKAKALVFIHGGWFFMNGLVALGILVNS